MGGTCRTRAGPRLSGQCSPHGQHQADEGDAGDRTGLHHDLSDYIRQRVAAVLTAGIDPAGNTAAPILDDIVARYAETFQTPDTPKYRTPCFVG
jgi:hypothetical protein